MCLLGLSLLAGCTRSASSDGLSRTVSPTMTDDVGYQHAPDEGRHYQKNDP
jgi:hypothetical protein